MAFMFSTMTMGCCHAKSLQIPVKEVHAALVIADSFQLVQDIAGLGFFFNDYW